MPDQRTPRLPAVACTCETCGAAFLAKAAKVRLGGGKFCSRACTGAARGNPSVEMTCPVCSTVFTTWSSQRRKFCSLPCKYEGTSMGRETLECEVCGTSYVHMLAPSRQRGVPRFCSSACRDERENLPLDVRFWQRVEKTTTCWLWTGFVRRDYGELMDWRADVRYTAHRLAWELRTGESIPDGLLVLHDCPDGDNPLCVRNDTEGTHVINGIARPQFGHLWVGTQADNMADMSAKGRTGRSILSPALVTESRRRYTAGEVSQGQLMQELEMSRSGIRHMLLGRTWKGVE